MADNLLQREKSLRKITQQLIDAYRRDLIRLLEIAVGEVLTAWSELSSPRVRNYLLGMNTVDLSPASIQRNLASSRSFFRHLKAAQLAPVNLFEGFRGRRKGKYLPIILTVKEFEMLLERPM